MFPFSNSVKNITLNLKSDLGPRLVPEEFLIIPRILPEAAITRKRLERGTWLWYSLMVLSVVSITSRKNITELCINYEQKRDDLRMQGRRRAREDWGKATIMISLH